MSEVGFWQSAAFYPTRTSRGVLADAIIDKAIFKNKAKILPATGQLSNAIDVSRMRFIN
ncbi:hypothetical protein [Paraburkholderia atlantica]|uniref:hypothetical protein n=1 Tax=Paraburkholderia atlantica TaxID=2654982 RepID=UPI0012FE9CAB|nr:hypothetical protein [Paraburkholderia atlantica]